MDGCDDAVEGLVTWLFVIEIRNLSYLLVGTCHRDFGFTSVILIIFWVRLCHRDLDFLRIFWLEPGQWIWTDVRTALKYW